MSEGENGGSASTGEPICLTLTWDPRTMGVKIGGTLPNVGFGVMLCKAAADEMERQIVEANRRASLAVSFPTPHGPRGRG